MSKSDSLVHDDDDDAVIIDDDDAVFIDDDDDAVFIDDDDDVSNIGTLRPLALAPRAPNWN